jgi:hypothetical protein
MGLAATAVVGVVLLPVPGAEAGTVTDIGLS